MYRPISHLPQCTRQIFHIAPIYKEMCTCLLQNGALWYGALWDNCLMNCGICEMGLLDLLYKSHNAPVPYPSIAPFCNRNVNISVTKCYIAGYMPDALWDFVRRFIEITFWNVKGQSTLSNGSVPYKWILKFNHMSVLVSHRRLIACSDMHFIILDNYKDSHLDNHEWQHATSHFDLSFSSTGKCYYQLIMA